MLNLLCFRCFDQFYSGPEGYHQALYAYGGEGIQTTYMLYGNIVAGLICYLEEIFLLTCTWSAILKEIFDRHNPDNISINYRCCLPHCGTVWSWRFALLAKWKKKIWAPVFWISVYKNTQTSDWKLLSVMMLLSNWLEFLFAKKARARFRALVRLSSPIHTLFSAAKAEAWARLPPEPHGKPSSLDLATTTRSL